MLFCLFERVAEMLPFFYYTNLLFAHTFYFYTRSRKDFDINYKFYVMTYNNHIEEYLNCKAKVQELLETLESTSVYGKLMGKENEYVVEILKNYISLMKKMSWEQEHSRMK